MLDHQHTSLLSSIFGKHKKAETIALGFLLAQAAFSGIKKYRDARLERKTVSLKFEEGTEEYRWLVRWLSEQPQIEDGTSGRSFVVTHLGDRGAAVPTSGTVPHSSKRTWALVPDNFSGYRFEGLTLSISRGEPSKEQRDYVVRRVVTLSCVTNDMRSVDRLLSAIHEAGTRPDDEDRVPRVFVRGRWDDWTEIRKAPLNRTPVLPTGILDAMSKDMDWFLKNEEWYQSVGVPYRRGYLFHGIPGSGKTTTAISLAAKFRKDVYVLPLEGINDERLLQAIAQVGKDGILLMEDIDCVSATIERGTQAPPGTKDTPTLQGLLNAIDGAATPEGRIVIGTTNRKEVLDKALIRPGRIDRQWEFVNADFDQILELCKRFGLGAESPSAAHEWTAEGVSMSTVQQRLIERCGLGGDQPVES